MTIKSVFISVLVFMLLSACNNSDSPEPIIEPTIEPEACDNVGCESNHKELIKQIYVDVLNNDNTGLVASLFADDVIQNNPAISAGPSGLVDFYTALKADNSAQQATIKHIVADGQYVAVHWHFSATPDNEMSGQAWIDLYKLLDDEVIEHWSKAMTLQQTTASGNSAFSDLYDYENTLPNNNTEVEEENKVMVTNLYTELFNNYNLALFDEKIDSNYLQHNQGVPDGSQPLRGWIASKGTPNVTIFLSLAEGDIVWTFQQDSQNLTTIDLWRVDNNIEKVVEHWDVF